MQAYRHDKDRLGAQPNDCSAVSPLFSTRDMPMPPARILLVEDEEAIRN